MSAYSQTLIDAAFTAFQAGHHVQAATALGFAVGTGRDGLVTWFLGHLALCRGDPAAALPWLAAAVELDPAHAKAHRDLADTQRLLGRLDVAVDAYQHAIAIDPAGRDLWRPRHRAPFAEP
jgi:tetratricopeptide (TPR) repeat protein